LQPVLPVSLSKIAARRILFFFLQSFPTVFVFGLIRELTKAIKLEVFLTAIACNITAKQ